MNFLRKCVQFCLLFTLMNAILIKEWQGVGFGRMAVPILLLAVFYIACLIFPNGKRTGISQRLSFMKGGHTLIVLAATCFVAEGLLYIAIYSVWRPEVSWEMALINGVISLFLISFLLFSGFVRIILTSTQLGIVVRLLLLLTWWIPLWNAVLFVKACGLVKREYYFEMTKSELNEARKDSEICRTKYPILLVHGIFFRDWQFLNYWGRIPKELSRNGAMVFYGRQQSAAPVKASAAELAQRIREIIDTEGCEKVNIIAHSKGGLDARYAISCLDMDAYVASLTTINTPHHGCEFAEKLLHVFPRGLIQFISKKYNGVFRRLGDSHPDFLGGVSDLTAAQCQIFNEQAKNREGVLYQSAMSRMKGMFSAGFPLFFTYPIVHFVEGENDGLVTPASAKWGHFLGLVTGTGRRGVSHGDMVDLMRENIVGFDVSEFYVNITKGLKERGL